MNKELFVCNHVMPELAQKCIQKDKIYFYCGSDLEILIGNSYIVFGDVFSYDNQHSVKRGLDLMDNSDIDIDAVEHELYYWGGRYVLYYKNRFFMDCRGLLGLFYHNGDDGWFITSSPRLVLEDIGVDIIQNPPSFKWGEFLNYFPLPKTMLLGVEKLDNCDGLEVEGIEVKPFLRCVCSNIKDEDINLLCEKIKIAFGCFASDLKKKYGDHIALELTAGVDSRFDLAMLLENGCKPRVYSHYTPRFHQYDMSIPKKIAKMFGLKILVLWTKIYE